MVGFLKRLFTPSVAQPGADPSPTPVPPPTRPMPIGIGVVWRADGTPKLEKDFVDAINRVPVMRVTVNNMLLARGFKLTDEAPYYTGA